MRSIYPFHYFEPSLFSGLLDDPVLLLQIRGLGRSFMVDCGPIHHLAKRVINSVDRLFITHAHMDHFMGVDHFARNVLVSGRTIDLYGPAGFATRLNNKLSSYEWNLTEPYYCVFRVHEITENRARVFRMAGAEQFVCEFEEEIPLFDREIYRNRFVTVESAVCDHKIPCLIFKFTERLPFLIDGDKVNELNLIKGPWLRELKKSFFLQELERKPLRVLQRDGENEEKEVVFDSMELYQAIRKEQESLSIGYVTDVGLTHENMEKIHSLMEGVTLLVCECQYMRDNQKKARESFHLCTDDLNTLVEKIAPRFVLPIHLSKSYQGNHEQLYQELEFPKGTDILKIPPRLTTRPLLRHEVPEPETFCSFPVSR